MADKRVFINSENKATFVCEKCTKAKTVDVSKYKNINRAVRIKCHCNCGHSYSVLLERRKTFRKQTRLSGVYIYGSKGFRGPIRVLDLSRTGIKIEVLDSRRFQPGDIFKVEFKLDDPQSSLIEKEVEAKLVKQNTVGGEFTSVSSTDFSDKKIAFYVMP